MAELKHYSMFDAFSQGRELGREMRATKLRDNAFARYSGGDTQGGISGLIEAGDLQSANALTGMSDRQQQMDLAKRTGGMAAAGDYTGARREALTAGNADLAQQFAQMSAEQFKVAQQQANTVGALAYKFEQIPFEQRAAVWGPIKAQLAQQGYKPEQLDQVDLSNEGLRALKMGAAETVDELEKAALDRQYKKAQIDATRAFVPLREAQTARARRPPAPRGGRSGGGMPAGMGGGPVVVSDPAAYAALPSGTLFTAPDGTTRRKP